MTGCCDYSTMNWYLKTSPSLLLHLRFTKQEKQTQSLMGTNESFVALLREIFINRKLMSIIVLGVVTGDRWPYSRLKHSAHFRSVHGFPVGQSVACPSKAVTLYHSCLLNIITTTFMSCYTSGRESFLWGCDTSSSESKSSLFYFVVVLSKVRL